MKQVKCPGCGKVLHWSDENPFRPFCSERCKQIDLGAWASDRYSIAGAGGTGGDESNGPVSRD